MPSVESLQKDKQLMVSYLQLKLAEEDWHGVADAAMDLRDIEAKLSVIKTSEVIEIYGLTPNQVLDLIRYYEKNTGLKAKNLNFNEGVINGKL